MTSGVEVSSETLYREWLEHRHFRYRGCAPDADDPQRMAGNPDLPVGAHHGPDAFVAEGQRERLAREAAAVEVCLSCPVMVACDAYASSVVTGADGVARLAQPDGVWGGRRALERHRVFIAARHAVVAAPDRRFETAQKRAVLRALAGVWDPYEVAAAAGVDVRTANWQRSSLVRLLGLPKDVSRMRALAAARERGLLEGVVVVADDGSVPAVPPPTRLAGPTQLILFEPPGSPVEPPIRRRVRVVSRRSPRVVSVPLTLDEVLVPAPVLPLFPTASSSRKAAA
ncbi:WhiB family transcriptional regulator [Streptomyces longwoodensis]|uniref:WhiB family transcriptional regulator n=1 Tax=Streptomyces longwoodensis TaxID=68231 RepID=UPI00225B5334|nr:WhiB family transcriptional regulator [Streptomyces longwoodensis]MCX5000949.1 WhiB family transcriptional regulator [Streptomyces longwoodensis]